MFWRTAKLIAVFSVGLCLSTSITTAQQANGINAIVASDGTIELEGVRYIDDTALKAKVDEINKRQFKPVFHVKALSGSRFEIVGRAIMKLQAAGANVPMGFLTEPRPLK